MDKLNYIEGLIKGDKDVIYSIYQSFLPDVTRWVLKNSGSEQDAFDVFQDSLEAILSVISDKEWNTELPFGAYLFRVCRNKWISQLRKNNKEKTVRITELNRYTEKQYDELFTSERHENELKIKSMLEDTFQDLSPLCRKLIPLTETNMSASEIAEALDMAAASTVHRRKFACLESWKKLILKHKYFHLWESRNT